MHTNTISRAHILARLAANAAAEDDGHERRTTESNSKGKNEYNKCLAQRTHWQQIEANELENETPGYDARTHRRRAKRRETYLRRRRTTKRAAEEQRR